MTVEVAASSSCLVEVTAAAADEHRREAELGARWALQGLPAPARVTVTDVVITDVDTSVGDVYEAAARAVWQALGVEQKAGFAAFSDSEMVATWLTSMVGRRLDAVTEARYWYEGRRGPDADSLLHAWLLFEGAMSVGLHGRGDQLLLATEDPYSSYDMDEYGQTVVGPVRRPDVLSGFVGARLADGAVIFGRDGDAVCTGLLLRFDNDDLVIGTLGDEWVLAAGPMPAAAGRSWTVQPLVGGQPFKPQ